MRILLSIILSITFWAPAFAADMSHEEAANNFYGAWMNVDRPRLIQGFAAAVGSNNPDTRAVVLEALESPELEAIYVKHLIKVFTADELAALNAMAQTAGFKIWSERLPAFSAQLLPDVINFFRSNAPELSRRVAEKRKKAGSGS